MLGALADPNSFIDGPPHEMLAELRRTSPVAWQEMNGEPGFYAVLSHADVVRVARAEPTVFSASTGGIVLENGSPESLEMSRNMLVAMDPPRHVSYRKPVAPSFRGRVIAQLEGQIRENRAATSWRRREVPVRRSSSFTRSPLRYRPA